MKKKVNNKNSLLFSLGSLSNDVGKEKS